MLLKFINVAKRRKKKRKGKREKKKKYLVSQPPFLFFFFSFVNHSLTPSPSPAGEGALDFSTVVAEEYEKFKKDVESLVKHSAGAEKGGEEGDKGSEASKGWVPADKGKRVSSVGKKEEGTSTGEVSDEGSERGSLDGKKK